MSKSTMTVGQNRQASSKAAPNAPEKAPARPEAASAAPVAKDKKRDKKERAKFTVPEGGFEAWPADFDAKKHKPLRRVDFKDHRTWLTQKAEQAEKAAAAFRKEIEEITAAGGTKSMAKAKKMVRVQAERDLLMEALKKSGVNVDELLAEKEAEIAAKVAEEKSKRDAKKAEKEKAAAEAKAAEAALATTSA